jgi:hypothetical protein
MARPDDGPLVLAALVCEQVLEERDGVLSATRIVDRVIVERHDDGVPAVQVRYLVMLRRGMAAIGSGEHEASIVLRYPSGEHEVVTREPWKVSWPPGEAQDEGVNLNVTLRLGLPAEGLYWLEVLFDGAHVAATPLRVIFGSSD